MDDAARSLPMFPLSTVLLPGEVIPLHVFEPRYRELTEHCLAGDGNFGVVLIARGSEIGGGDQRHEVGTIAHIEDSTRFDDGRFGLLARGTERLRVRAWLPDTPYPVASVETALMTSWDAGGVGGRRHRTRHPTYASVLLRARRGTGARRGAGALPDAEAACWQLAALAPLSPFDRQRLVEIDDIVERFALLMQLATDQAERSRTAARERALTAPLAAGSVAGAAGAARSRGRLSAKRCAAQPPATGVRATGVPAESVAPEAAAPEQVDRRRLDRGRARTGDDDAPARLHVSKRRRTRSSLGIARSCSKRRR